MNPKILAMKRSLLNIILGIPSYKPVQTFPMVLDIAVIPDKRMGVSWNQFLLAYSFGLTSYLANVLVESTCR